MTPALQLEFLDLRHFSAQHLRPLLDEESALWSQCLHWDYRNSATLVLQYIESHLLTGYVALDQGHIRGYIFCVYENRKAVIGDVFASRQGIDESAAIAIEAQLVERLLETLQHTPGLVRVEAQLLLHPHRLLSGPFEKAGFRLFQRLFMESDLDDSPREIDSAQRGPFETAAGAHYRRWMASDYDLAPQCITAGYAGHIDSEINDQYLSASGAQRFLHNIVRFSGCGIFEEQSSWVLASGDGRKLFGLLLCSRVSERVGHVTQVCVLPEFQCHGVGKKLLQLCASSLQARKFESITLTVTERNAVAVKLYKQLGYRVRHHFDAMLWENATQR
ncbi:MAG TPA: N-acetyltransferase [Acidobacteriaceae bacterium]|nr:N-acetyltransferase [Acidobacteriaceae bacterium]